MKDFRSIVTALWTRLQLGEPRFTENGRVQLRIDGMGIELIDNGRGRLIAEGDIGPLATDRVARARQTRRILETNLGFTTLGEAGLYLRTRPNGERALAARGSYAMQQANLDSLVKVLEDVLQAVEFYRAEFRSPGTVTGARQTQAAGEAVDTAMIFRP